MVGVLCCTNHTPRGWDSGSRNVTQRRTVTLRLIIREKFPGSDSETLNAPFCWWKSCCTSCEMLSVGEKLGPPIRMGDNHIYCQKCGFMGYAPFLDHPNIKNIQKLSTTHSGFHLQRGAGFLSSTLVHPSSPNNGRKWGSPPLKLRLLGDWAIRWSWPPSEAGENRGISTSQRFFVASPMASGRRQLAGHTDGNSTNAVLLPWYGSDVIKISGFPADGDTIFMETFWQFNTLPWKIPMFQNAGSSHGYSCYRNIPCNNRTSVVIAQLCGSPALDMLSWDDFNLAPELWSFPCDGLKLDTDCLPY